MKVITITNVKGGVSKSTVSIFTALQLADRGFKTLLIDMDGHHNSTSSHFISDYNIAENKSIYRILKEQITPDEAIYQINENLSLIPASYELTQIDSELTGAETTFLLRELLSDTIKQFDFIIIDTPPELTRATELALTISNTVIIPTQLEKWSIKAIYITLEKIKKIQKYINNSLTEILILPTFVKQGTVLTQAIKDELLNDDEIQGYVLKDLCISRRQEIPNTLYIGEAESLNKTSDSYKEFETLIDRITA